MCDMDGKRDRTVTVRVTAEELARLDQVAEAEDRDRSRTIRRAIQQYLEKEDDK